MSQRLMCIIRIRHTFLAVLLTQHTHFLSDVNLLTVFCPVGFSNMLFRSTSGMSNLSMRLFSCRSSLASTACVCPVAFSSSPLLPDWVSIVEETEHPSLSQWELNPLPVLWGQGLIDEEMKGKKRKRKQPSRGCGARTAWHCRDGVWERDPDGSACRDERGRKKVGGK